MDHSSSVESFTHFVLGFLFLIILSFGITFSVSVYLSAQQQAEVAAAARATLVAQ